MQNVLHPLARLGPRVGTFPHHRAKIPNVGLLAMHPRAENALLTPEKAVQMSDPLARVLQYLYCAGMG
jgi:hypothetical protein